MRIVSVYRYFWPDNAPYGRILKILLGHLSEQGHECTVLTGYPTYNYSGKTNVKKEEYVDRVFVRRFMTTLFSSRLVDFILFFIRSFFYIVKNKEKYDLILVNSFPPVFMGVFARVVSRITGIPYVYHVQDVHPECLKLSGKVKSRFLVDALRKLDEQNCRKAARCITLSHDMRRELSDRGYGGGNIHVINNPSQTVDMKTGNIDLPKEFPTDKFTILFAGNMGNFQSLDLFIEAARILQNNRDIVFVFMGDGAAKGDLTAQAGELIGKNVVFIPYQPSDVAGKAMMTSSLGLVSLNAGLSRVAYPSKVPTLLNHECPVLVLVEPESELARGVRDHKLGFVLSKRDPGAIAESIEEIWRERDVWNTTLREKMSRNALDAFGINTVMGKWSSLLEGVEEGLEV